VHSIAAVQEEWSLVQRDVAALVPTLAELGVTVLAHSPTRHGVLHRGDSATGATTYAGLRSALSDVAVSHDATPGQVALARVHHRPQIWGLGVVPLPGTTSLGHLRTNFTAADPEPVHRRAVTSGCRERAGCRRPPLGSKA